MSPKVGVAPLRREQIVRATIRCLARDGYAGLTMKKVARTAGVSQGILHYYFADKRAILVAALEMVRSEEHTSELQSRLHLVCRLLLEKKKKKKKQYTA